MRTIATLAIGTMLALGSGCGDNERPDEPIEIARITYARSGGIAGIDETLTVGRDGSGEFEKRFVEDSHVVQFQLEPSELEKLNELLSELDFDSLDTGQSARCADCFVYEISYGGETLTADEITAKPELREAIGILQATIRTP
jgi:hypothetical protein